MQIEGNTSQTCLDLLLRCSLSYAKIENIFIETRRLSYEYFALSYDYDKYLQIKTVIQLFFITFAQPNEKKQNI